MIENGAGGRRVNDEDVGRATVRCRQSDVTSSGDAAILRRQELSRNRFVELLRERLLEEVTQRVGDKIVNEAIEAIATRRLDPYTATEHVLAAAGLGESS